MRKLYYNGKIITAVDKEPYAAGVVTDGDIITEVIPLNEKIDYSKYRGVGFVDLCGNTLVPGFIDAHSHFIMNALNFSKLRASPSPLGKADSVDELVAYLKEQLKDPKFKDKEFLTGFGYDDSVYYEGRPPNRYDLDKVTDKPLAVSHISEHNVVYNSAALRAAGIDDNYRPPYGGSVGRDKNGHLTGIFYENARLAAFPKETKDEGALISRGWRDAILQYSSKGITTAHDALTSAEWYGYARKICDAGQMPIDLVSYISGDGADEILTDEAWNVSYKNHYRAAGRKVFLDGSPQIKSAWFSKPYKTVPEGESSDYRGYGTFTDEALEAEIAACIDNNRQFNAHANGDEAIEQFIRVFTETAKKKNADIRRLRPVIIHCQFVRRDQLERIKKSGIFVSFFAEHAFYWGDYHCKNTVGEERARRLSPLQEALDMGITFTLHQDTPVTVINPIFAIHNAVNRKTRSGRVLGAEYRISAWEALKAVTINAAYQLFEEKTKGSIEAGKLADFAVLDADPLSCPRDDIKNINVIDTIKDGESIASLYSYI